MQEPRFSGVEFIPKTGAAAGVRLRKGERITCAKGHHVGDVLADVPDGVPVPTEALSISGPLIPDTRQGYVCGQCDEIVALIEGGSRWRVRTSRRWVS